MFICCSYLAGWEVVEPTASILSIWISSQPSTAYLRIWCSNLANQLILLQLKLCDGFSYQYRLYEVVIDQSRWFVRVIAT